MTTQVIHTIVSIMDVSGEEETEALRGLKYHRVGKWQSQDPNAGGVVQGPVFLLPGWQGCVPVSKGRLTPHAPAAQLSH